MIPWSCRAGVAVLVYDIGVTKFTCFLYGITCNSMPYPKSLWMLFGLTHYYLCLPRLPFFKVEHDRHCIHRFFCHHEQLFSKMINMTLIVCLNLSYIHSVFYSKVRGVNGEGQLPPQFFGRIEVAIAAALLLAPPVLESHLRP